jgi:hypothetical protein
VQNYAFAFYGSAKLCKTCNCIFCSCKLYSCTKSIYNNNLRRAFMPLILICSLFTLLAVVAFFPFFCRFFADFRVFSALLCCACFRVFMRCFSCLCVVFRVYAKIILHFLQLQNLQLHFTVMQNCAKSAIA